jgi:hypothetical protein
LLVRGSRGRRSCCCHGLVGSRVLHQPENERCLAGHGNLTSSLETRIRGSTTSRLHVFVFVSVYIVVQIAQQVVVHFNFPHAIDRLGQHCHLQAAVIPLTDIVPVALLQFPQAHIAGRATIHRGRGLVVVLIGVDGVEPAGAEIAKVRVAAAANHVVAAVRLLGGRVARRARARVQLEILERGLLLGRELLLVALGRAAVELAVPGLGAATAEGEAAVLTDGEQVGGVELFALRGLFLPFCRVVVVVVVAAAIIFVVILIVRVLCCVPLYSRLIAIVVRLSL